ncbi:NUDIX hydrolase [Cupriavidus plantarum]|uniref:NUDIX hydrolase n=1 Tax=Cupriavidus plantarum TaxID=942865 RepID=UPI000E37D895|nr:NUDIX hydrolase [Cupriavidus plantarum]NYH99064.1 8-oxo-dGTP pyrophosphatase MutT (NUDIX family) [Cupriavidus plantarum]REF02959.1 ADP-ribose pyrophosphatase YjhB (NUDIX family) [Cupriavidus plantarum]RLK44176.1 ADP-ribose pyrophosphatase YjhB (NUDIX family) [Cupriavidus plantarum]CAG2141865.1 Phosphatase NudJ [Cupriavidus plantarum]SMR65378.1 ADP-ribose pyrophosphatase YjhB, NUDIX family [Cupriavidus plantarum]
MSRDWNASVTVAAVIERGGRFLLVEEETPAGLQLNQPAGHLEPGESLINAVIRETLEETAHTFEPRALIGCYMSRGKSSRDQGDTTYIRFAFTGDLGSLDAGRQLDTGIVRTVWMSIDELRACRERHRSPLLMACVEDYVAGKRFALDVLYTHPTAVATEVAP